MASIDHTKKKTSDGGLKSDVATMSIASISAAG